uniref:F-box domain-containing protein n=1 Tax=Cafeteria roenbergensis TaxID=33653 RepID=A0A7S0JWF0_CAFRO
MPAPGRLPDRCLRLICAFSATEDAASLARTSRSVARALSTPRLWEHRLPPLILRGINALPFDRWAAEHASIDRVKGFVALDSTLHRRTRRTSAPATHGWTDPLLVPGPAAGSSAQYSTFPSPPVSVSVPAPDARPIAAGATAAAGAAAAKGAPPADDGEHGAGPERLRGMLLLSAVLARSFARRGEDSAIRSFRPSVKKRDGLRVCCLRLQWAVMWLRCAFWPAVVVAMALATLGANLMAESQPHREWGWQDWEWVVVAVPPVALAVVAGCFGVVLLGIKLVWDPERCCSCRLPCYRDHPAIVALGPSHIRCSEAMLRWPGRLPQADCNAAIREFRSRDLEGWVVRYPWAESPLVCILSVAFMVVLAACLTRPDGSGSVSWAMVAIALGPLACVAPASCALRAQAMAETQPRTKGLSCFPLRMAAVFGLGMGALISGVVFAAGAPELAKFFGGLTGFAAVMLMFAQLVSCGYWAVAGSAADDCKSIWSSKRAALALATVAVLAFATLMSMLAAVLLGDVALPASIVLIPVWAMLAVAQVVTVRGAVWPPPFAKADHLYSFPQVLGTAQSKLRGAVRNFTGRHLVVRSSDGAHTHRVEFLQEAGIL